MEKTCASHKDGVRYIRRCLRAQMCLHVSWLLLVLTCAASIVRSHLLEGNDAQKAELGSFGGFVTQSMKHVHSEKNTLDSLGQNVDFNCKRRFLRSEDLSAHVTAIGASAGGQQLCCGGLFSSLPPKLLPTIQPINYKPFTLLETATGRQFQMSFCPTSAWSNLLLWFEGKWLFENVKINLQPIGAVYLQMHYSSPQPSVWEMHICVSWILQIRQEKKKRKARGSMFPHRCLAPLEPFRGSADEQVTESPSWSDNCGISVGFPG